MPRTLPAELTAVMDAGIYEPYIRVHVNLNPSESGQETFQPLSYTLGPTDAVVVLPYDTGARDEGYFRIERGALIAGTPSTISTIWFSIIDTTVDGKRVTYYGHIVDRTYLEIAAGSNYETVIEEALTDIGANLQALIPSYEGTASWKAYQFYPDAKPIILHRRTQIFTLLQQKYLVFATEDGWDGSQSNVFFFVATQTRATDYTVVDPLCSFDFHYEARKLVWTDEFEIVHTDGLNNHPIHNLGYLELAADSPNDTGTPQNLLIGTKTRRMPVHLKYRTGDKVSIQDKATGQNFTANARIKVLEVLDTSATPAWYQVLSVLQYFGKNEGSINTSIVDIDPGLRERLLRAGVGRDPGFQEHIQGEDGLGRTGGGNFAQLDTGPFTNHLSPNANNVQRAMEVIDQHNHDTEYTDDNHDHAGLGGAPIDYTELINKPNMREKLTSQRTYYIRTDGSNANDGLTNTSNGAFLTIQKAIDTIAGNLDINGVTVTIQIADGTYTGAVVLKNVVGYAAPGNLVIQGNNGTPANVVISTTSADAITADGISTVWDIKDLKIQTTTQGNGIKCHNKATVRFSNLNFGSIGGTSAHIQVFYDASVIAIGNYAVSGNALFHWWINYGGFLDTSTRTITFSNSPTFTTFAVSFTLGKVIVFSMTFTNGGTVTAKRYDAQMNSAIFVNGGGAAYLPGGTVGTTATGGQYA